MCCAESADWKREEVPDHKFDFIDVRDYHTSGAFTRFRYIWVWVLVVKSVGVYVADIYTAITLLAYGHFSSVIFTKVETSNSHIIKVPFVIGKWIFFGCIIFSFILVAYEAVKARAVIRSRDISYAYTNVMANDYYSLKSYDTFCFFCQINNSKKKKDEFAFFIFFTFKGWKRLLLADGPRQVINGLTLYAFASVNHFSTNPYDYYQGSVVTAGMLLTMIFTVAIFAGSAILLTIAALMYVPLLCYIQGNLKEYCCHKIDKRISELVKKKQRQRMAKQAAIARAEAAGDFSHLKNKKGEMVQTPMPQPTLPNVGDVYDDDDFSIRDGKGGAPFGNVYDPGMDEGYSAYNDSKSMPSSAVPPGQDFDYPPPMPYGAAYETPYHGGGSVYEGSLYGSEAHLTAHPGYAGSVHSSPEMQAQRYRGMQAASPSLSPQVYPARFHGAASGSRSASPALGAFNRAASPNPAAGYQAASPGPNYAYDAAPYQAQVGGYAVGDPIDMSAYAPYSPAMGPAHVGGGGADPYQQQGQGPYQGQPMGGASRPRSYGSVYDDAKGGGGGGEGGVGGASEVFHNDPQARQRTLLERVNANEARARGNLDAAIAGGGGLEDVYESHDVGKGDARYDGHDAYGAGGGYDRYGQQAAAHNYGAGQAAPGRNEAVRGGGGGAAGYAL